MFKSDTTKTMRSLPDSASDSTSWLHTEDMVALAGIERTQRRSIMSAKCSHLVGRLSSKLQRMSSTSTKAIKHASQKMRSVLNKSARNGSTTDARSHDDSLPYHHDTRHETDELTQQEIDILFDSFSSVTDSGIDMSACGLLPAHDADYTPSPYVDTDTSMEVCEWASSPDIAVHIYAVRSAAAADDGADTNDDIRQSEGVLRRASCLNRADDRLYHVPGRLNISLPKGATGSMHLPSRYPRGAKGLKRPDDYDFPSWHPGPDGYMVPTQRLPRGVFLPKPSRLCEVETAEDTDFGEEGMPVRLLSQNVSQRSLRRTKAMVSRQHPAINQDQASDNAADDSLLCSDFDGNWVTYGNDSDEKTTRELDVMLEEDSIEEHTSAECFSEVSKQARLGFTQRVKAESIKLLRPFSSLFAIVASEDIGSEEDDAVLEQDESYSGSSTRTRSTNALATVQVQAFNGEDYSECDASNFSIFAQGPEEDATEFSEQSTMIHHEAQFGVSEGGRVKLSVKSQEQLADMVSSIEDEFDHDDNELVLPCSLPALPIGVQYAEERTSIISRGPHLIIPERRTRIAMATGGLGDDEGVEKTKDFGLFTSKCYL
ncbi:uncharacterized protein BKCO1_1000187 [Diplodia corticola]|uniref:Uncharacterized protein n=1 Tax=Diplodia corticola TaxID=236234 RepID=A0A1J9RIQ2_9PEZI|nr:uncharacterized protein BKCO1_1000187 [Diplodia corticola]OJD40345.1 hypothetical protein BKCO1_1000187 [Diplodia corticola]